MGRIIFDCVAFHLQDIIALQDFRTESTNQLAKIRLEIAALLEEDSSAQAIPPTNLTIGQDEQGTFVSLREEARELKTSLESLKEAELLFRDQIQQVFADVDQIKAGQRQIGLEQEKAARSIGRLRSEDIVDINTRQVMLLKLSVVRECKRGFFLYVSTSGKPGQRPERHFCSN